MKNKDILENIKTSSYVDENESKKDNAINYLIQYIIDRCEDEDNDIIGVAFKEDNGIVTYKTIPIYKTEYDLLKNI